MPENIKNETVLYGLSNTLFWDTDISTLDAEKHALTIVERVLTRGTWDEFKLTLKFYGKTRVAKLVSQIRYLNDIVLEFCVTYFNLKKNDLECYKNKQLNGAHWNY